MKPIMLAVLSTAGVALCLVAALFILQEQYRLELPEINEYSENTIGTCDVMASWGAARAFRQGRSPYDRAELLEQQRAGGYAFAEAQPFLNPPWSLPIFVAFLPDSFALTVISWLGVSVVLYIISAVLVGKAEGATPALTLAAACACLLFYPVIENLFWGQVGALLLLGVAGFY